LTLSQGNSGGSQDQSRPSLPIPVRLALFADSGEMLPLHVDGQTRSATNEQVVVLDQRKQRFVFHRIDAKPVPSLLRGFSAPVILECDYTPRELALLLGHDADGFNRWEAGQQLAARAYENLRDEQSTDALDAWCEALASLFVSESIDDALMADLLTPPGEIELAERETAIDPERIHVLREALQEKLASRLGRTALRQRYESLAAHTSIELDAVSQARRRLKRRVLQLLHMLDGPGTDALAATQYHDAPGMTDRLAALALLVHTQSSQAGQALDHYRTRYADNALALDKWFAIQAQLPGDAALAKVTSLEHDAAFTLKNPNRVQALLGAFVRGNQSGFHRADGAGYRLLADRLVTLDALNPQVAARLATAFNGWRRLEPLRRERARRAIAGLAEREGLSRNLAEIVCSVLNH
jgi:aminopeptidase N